MKESEIERFLPKAKEELHKIREENQFLKMLGTKREGLASKHTQELIKKTTTRDWEKKYNEKMDKRRLMEIKKRLTHIKNKTRPGRT